ncbi:MAG: beta-ketoacyl-[acyl-carrier-protein] synthase family protein [Spirochaetes bacterium]|nr:beta-ketoacyl-[acyl-carrier-protein] synthase family protein [Spirochaetota bacterium]
MALTRVFITGAGIISPLGRGLEATLHALLHNVSGIAPVSLFGVSGPSPLPVGEAPLIPEESTLPRTHLLALAAAEEALAGHEGPVDAVCIGTSTGGMAVTETLLRDAVTDPSLYRHHSTGTVAAEVAQKFGCRGPLLTVSTACSSSAVAIAMAARMIQACTARMVLAGGADSLCRLTYYGFNSLQLLDPAGARPLDRDRRGMSVSEGAAMLLLEGGDSPPPGALAEVTGWGLSCDAYHPAAPRPDGGGAMQAMRSALEMAGIPPGGVDYVNLHGTGTVDNDQAEATAVRGIFGGHHPPLSSIKGATGHSLGAAGAIEAVASTLALKRGIIPANTGCAVPDQALGITPVLAPVERPLKTVLSNSFGFGGNNAALLFCAPEETRPPAAPVKPPVLRIIAAACATGAGGTESTMARIVSGSAAGIVPREALDSLLSPKEVRRLKRLPRISLALAQAVLQGSGTEGIFSVYYGTGWGALSETADFLGKLYESQEQFTSPTDFVGSVHNAPAGQIAIKYSAGGANLTFTGGDHTFEQALLALSLFGSPGPSLLIGADEYHEALMPLLQENHAAELPPSEGGGALIISAADRRQGPVIAPLYLGQTLSGTETLEDMALRLREMDAAARYGAVFAGIPRKHRECAGRQMAELRRMTGLSCPMMDYRERIGEHSSATACAAALAARLCTEGSIPGGIAGDEPVPLRGRGVLLLGLGENLSATEIMP